MSKEVNQALNAIELLNKRIEAASEATRKAQEAARTANEAMSVLAKGRKAVEALRASLAATVENAAGELIEAEVKVQVARLNEATTVAIEDKYRSVIAGFEDLRKILTGEEDPNRPSIPEYLRQAREVLGVEWPQLMSYIKAAAAVSRGCTTLDCPGVVKWAVKIKIDTGIIHVHICGKCYTEYRRDMHTEIFDSVLLETKVCPWQHPLSKNVAVHDTETHRWTEKPRNFFTDGGL
jgi:hypothetical protein